jgi:DNA (cytosine-5)-methyltransferase 1
VLTIKPENKFLRGVTFIDLFAGIGGFRLALGSFGGKCVFSSDWDPHAKAVYQANFGETPAGDITLIDNKDIPAHDILCAGFPCQPFSIAGEKAGFADTRGTLFHHIVRIADHHRPRMLFLENVRNLATHDDGKTLETILEALGSVGYDVHHKVLNASHYGIPQARERIYILGFRRDLKVKNFEFPAPVKQTCKLADLLLPNKLTAGSEIDSKKKCTFKKVRVIPGTPKPVRIGELGLGRQGERIYHPDAHAVTLSAQGGGVGGKTGLYKVAGKVRRLHPRECARINGFPDTFKIHERPAEALEQFGNSVVIDVLQHILLAAKPIFE